MYINKFKIYYMMSLFSQNKTENCYLQETSFLYPDLHPSFSHC